MFYYMLGIPFLLVELSVIYSPKKWQEFVVKYLAQEKDFTSDQLLYTVFSLVYCFWTLGGLLTSNWRYFLVLIILPLISYKKKHWVLRFIDAILSATILVLILISSHYKLF